MQKTHLTSELTNELLALEIIADNAKLYDDVYFKNVDKVILDVSQDESKVEIYALMLTMRKSIQSLFYLEQTHAKYLQDKEHDLQDDEAIQLRKQILNTLTSLVSSNMQLSSYNSIFNYNSELVNQICQHQCWLANALVMTVLQTEKGSDLADAK